MFAGVPYLVGERGPELFTSGVSGRITPNNRLAFAGAGAGLGGGGTSVVVNVHGALMGSSVPEVASIIRAELKRIGNRNDGVGLS